MGVRGGQATSEREYIGLAGNPAGCGSRSRERAR
ncbi:MAG: hypothetical protein JWO39_937 [Gemmatimonadetes bacterium]|nr:hypothetical protein [Gemmatimonadota bacterium]